MHVVLGVTLHKLHEDEIVLHVVLGVTLRKLHEDEIVLHVVLGVTLHKLHEDAGLRTTTTISMATNPTANMRTWTCMSNAGILLRLLKSNAVHQHVQLWSHVDYY